MELFVYKNSILVKYYIVFFYLFRTADVRKTNPNAEAIPTNLS